MLITYYKQKKIVVWPFTHESSHTASFSSKLNYRGDPVAWGCDLVFPFRSKGKLYLKIRDPVRYMLAYLNMSKYKFFFQVMSVHVKAEMVR